MKIKFYKTLWGMSGDLKSKLTTIKAAGYDGFEDWVMPHGTVRPLLDDLGIEFVSLVAGSTPDQFKRDIGEAYDCGVKKVTVHACGAHWSEDDIAKFLESALKSAEQVPFQVNFETHRGRALYEPLSTYRMLTRFPNLHLVADFSHWTVVTESMLDPFKKELDLAISRVRHLHARVGHEEGPQVPDPRVAQWKGHVDRHMVWWDAIKAAHEARGEAEMSIDPEFGPPNYMWTNPEDGSPSADLWDVSLWMRDQLKSRWK